MALLEVQGLSKRYPVLRRGLFRQRQTAEIRAVDDVSFALSEGETLGLVGESGCGKTTTARSILNLVTPSEGAIRFAGEDLVTLFRGGERDRVLRVRRSLQYVFQDPYLSLNPRWTAGETLKEPLRVHMPAQRAEWEQRVGELLQLVGLERHHAWRYPHEFSGGQRQRIGIARALAVEPRLLILDEPVSSLDLSVRAQILNLLVEVQERLGLAYLYISHDLSSVRFISTQVAVMYLGRLVEIGPVDAIFTRPLHHYTRALLNAIPVAQPGGGKRRPALPGEVPSALRRPPGCPFHPRCAAALPICREVMPALEGGAHLAACHNPL
ncbi:MAG: ATP-binding cassette domain-containing protein [Acetobacteraceae bacterium]|nr:ATP-binding cassette domain-containing protein [Acetobacteraceae bacterium]